MCVIGSIKKLAVILHVCCCWKNTEVIILPLSPRMLRHIRDLRPVQNPNLKSFLLTNEPKYTENGGNGKNLGKFYSITRQVSLVIPSLHLQS